ncbi:PREDICTED: ras-related protein Rab-26-like [Ceratosolen solmsi marchali]|uniref:Ras-related protein Rab-26-like n=1 Tax=Ceratosolen solmsi marchali TaxID=326594 RepID=A0AAJ6YRB7_9HYME|nr:PREDICTED: ras-related protein Rab-26-like [Ceratosolen solmsi marchali]
MGDNSTIDNVFKVEEYKVSPPEPHCNSAVTERLACKATPSPTGYRDYKPPIEVLRQSTFTKSKLSDTIWNGYYKHDNDNPKNSVHKTILLGDSGVGKTSLLIQFDIKKFRHSNFAATVGIGFTKFVY